MRICAPFAGIVRFLKADGEHVSTGETLALVETVKLEAPVVAPGPGRMSRVLDGDFVDVEGGDVLCEVVHE